MNRNADEAWIVERAKAQGFDLCGIVRVEKFPELAKFKEWLRLGYAGEMKYLEDLRRTDPWLVIEDLRSAIVCALNYNTAHPYSTEAAGSAEPVGQQTRGWFTRYAWGDDYHDVMWSRLNAMVEALKQRFPEPFAARAYADTGPVAERILAKYAGLGWLGKNTLLLNKAYGSWLFLGVILTSLDLPPSLEPAESPTRFVRQLPALPGRVSHGGVRRTVRARRAPLHFVSDDRATRKHPRGIPRAHWLAGLRM